MRIYIENLSVDTTRDEIRDLFSEYGQIGRVGLAKEKAGQQSSRRALVEMDVDAEGRVAINALNGTVLRDRAMKVRVARGRADQEKSNGTGGS